MTTAVQHRRGTTAEHATFTGLEGEVTIDTTKDTAVIHDGILAGGVPLARENLANVTPSGLATITGASTAADDKFFIYDQSATTLKSITRAELNNAMEIDALANVTITGGTINGTTIGNTTAAAGTFSQVNFADNAKAIFGAGSDLQIYHDGFNSYIDDAGTGDLFIRGSAITRLQSYAGEDMVVAVTNGAVNLYHDNSKKLATTSTGIDVTGLTDTDTLSVSGNTTLGDASTDTVTVNGYMGIGGAATATSGIYLTSPSTSGVGQYGVNVSFTGSSGATSVVAAGMFKANTAAASYTSTEVFALRALDAGKGAGSTITNQYGLYIADQTQGTNNYGITSVVSSGTNKWNIYASGSAANYFAGNVGIGSAAFGTADKLLVRSGAGGTSTFVHASGAGGVRISGTASASGASLYFANNFDTTVSDKWLIGLDGSTSSLYFQDTAERFRLKSTEAVFNDISADYDFRVESDTNSHAFFLEGSSGNVGINMSLPLSPLHVKGSTSDILRLERDASNQWRFQLSTGALLFSDLVAGQERLRIDSSGNVGIGTSSPAYKLDVSGSADVARFDTTSFGGVLFSRANLVGNGSTHYSLQFVNSDSTVAEIKTTNQTGGTTSTGTGYELRFAVAGTGYQTWFTNSIERLRIDSAGNLGLGVTPSAWRTLYSQKALQFPFGSLFGLRVSASDNRLSLGNNLYQDSAGYYVYLDDGHATLYQTSAGQHIWYNAPSGSAGGFISVTQAMTLDASGNLALGATSVPTNRKFIVEASGDTVGRINSGGATSGLSLEFANNGTIRGGIGNGSGNITSGSASDMAIQAVNNLVFASGGYAEKMRIDSSGNLGIGTSSPAKKLEISGSNGVAARITQTTSASDTYSQLEFYDSALSSTQAYIRTLRQGATAQSSIAFATKDSSTLAERMRIDSSGNLLVGTTIAAGKLAVNGKIRVLTGNFELDSGQVTTNSSANPLRLGVDGVEKVRIDTSGNLLVKTVDVRIGSDVGAVEYGTSAPNSARFYTDDIERMRIDGSGRFLVGTTSYFDGAYKMSLAVSGSLGGIIIKPGADNYTAMRFNNASSTQVGTITVSSTATSYNTASDYRLKEDWVAVADASTRVNALKPVNFAWKVDGKRVDGFLAHEVSEVVPEAVTGEKDAVDAEGNPVYQGIDQSKLVPLLTAALQEALAEINALKARLDAANL